jgi:hypothetical protein
MKPLTAEQCDVIAQIIDRPKLALWADMGAGKTAIAFLDRACDDGRAA